MKTLLLIFTSALLLAAIAPPLHAREPASIDFFYDNLEPYGSWREVGDYGYCWQPSGVDQEWRPYSDGRWVYSEAGWTWDSDEPYGWAVYHYGRWADVENVGWVWIPGTEWGPGWVSWRHSSRYVGWAPLPPEALFLRAIGFSGWVDDYYDIGPRNYRFVESRNFGSRRMNSVFIDERQNLTIIHETTNITNITYQGDFVHNGGPRFDQQSRQSDEPLHRYKLERRQDFRGDDRRPENDQLRSHINGDSLSMLALPFDGKHAAAPRKLVEKIDRAEVRNGWKGAGSAADIEEARARLKSKTRKPDELPPRAKFDKTREGDHMPEPQNKAAKPNASRDDKSRSPEDPSSPMKKQLPTDRPPQPKENPSKPGMNRDDKPHRPEDPSSPTKKQFPTDRPPQPKENPSKPGMNRDDKPHKPDSTNSSPTKKPDPVDRPTSPKTEPKHEKPKQPAEASKPQQERKPQADPPSQPNAMQEHKPKADPPSQPKPKQERKPQAEPRPQPKPQPQAEKKRPEAPPQSKPAPQAKPKNKGKPDEKDKDKEKDKKRGTELNYPC